MTKKSTKRIPLPEVYKRIPRQKSGSKGVPTSRNGWGIDPRYPYTFLLYKWFPWSDSPYFLTLLPAFSRGEDRKLQTHFLSSGLHGPVLAPSSWWSCSRSISAHLWRWEMSITSLNSPCHEESSGTPIHWTILHGSKLIQGPTGPTNKFWAPGDISFVRWWLHKFCERVCVTKWWNGFSASIFMPLHPKWEAK